MKDRLYSRFAGCLLGGAVGDALGYPVEFLREKGIEKEYGPQGIQTLQQAGNPAVISDDTQMTLFTANALLYGMTRTNLDAKPVDFGLAYREWLATQGDPSRMDDPNEPEMWLMRIPQLHVPRAPGNTCLSALTGFRRIGSVERPLNHSKGCGGVMRVAPIGLVSSVCQQEKPSFTAYLAAEAAAVTHGHPLGYTSAALLAEIVRRIVWEQADTLEEHICAAAEAILPQFDAAQELRDRIFQICTLAQDPHVSDLNGVHACGEGWTGDEALYVAIFCALRYPNDFAAALRCAVNHGGDSDSTGAICGNILGAWLGREAVAQAFSLEHLELRDVIENIAADLYTAAVRGIPQGDLLWDSKYREAAKCPRSLRRRSAAGRTFCTRLRHAGRWPCALTRTATSATKAARRMCFIRSIWPCR